MIPKIYHTSFFTSYEGGHCDPLNRKLRKNPVSLLKTLLEMEKMLFTSLNSAEENYKNYHHFCIDLHVASASWTSCTGIIYHLWKFHYISCGLVKKSPVLFPVLTPYLICQCLAFPIQQQIKIQCHKNLHMGIQDSDRVENIAGKDKIAR